MTLQELLADRKEAELVLSNPLTDESVKKDARADIAELDALIEEARAKEAQDTPPAKPKTPSKPKSETAPKTPSKPKSETAPKTPRKPKGETATKTPRTPKPAGTRVTTKKMSWKTPIKLGDLKDYGELYELQSDGLLCPQIAVQINEDVSVLAKGNHPDHPSIAKKGELVTFVHIKDDMYQQFNIIGNPEDKCIRTSELVLNSKGEVKREPVKDLTPIEAKAQKGGDSQALQKETEKLVEKTAEAVAIVGEAIVAVEAAKDEAEKSGDDKTAKKLEEKARKLKEKKAELAKEKQEIAKNKGIYADTVIKDRYNLYKPEQYRNDKYTQEAVAKALFADSLHAKMGYKNDTVITALFRRAEDNRVVFEMRLQNGEGFGTPEYYLLGEKSGRVTQTDAPHKLDVLVDARRAVLKEYASKAEMKDFEPTASERFLDKIYSGKESECMNLEAELHTCRSGANCSEEEKEALKKMAKSCKGIGHTAAFYAHMKKIFWDKVREYEKIKKTNKKIKFVEVMAADEKMPPISEQK